MKIQTIQEIKLDLLSKNYELDDYQSLKLAIDIQRNQILQEALFFKHEGKGKVVSALFDISCEIEKISNEINNK